MEFLNLASVFGWDGDVENLSNISEAIAYLDNNIGQLVDNPGYTFED